VILQEHKLLGNNARELGQNLWPEATYFTLEAIPGYALNQGGAGKGGVSILVSPYLKYMVECSNLVRDNRAIWITLARIPIGKLGILNIYASNSSQERGML
jgi:hypothetical protein